MTAANSSLPRATRRIPQDAGLPFFGYLFEFMKDPLAFAQMLERRNGLIVRTPMVGRDSVVMLGPEAAQFVLQDRDENFSSHGGWDYFIGKVFPGSIMATDAPAHRFQRRIMQQAFKKPALTAYIEAMNPRIAEGLDGWEPRPDFPVFQSIKQLTLDLATAIFLGEEIGPDAARMNQAFIDTVDAALAYIRAPIPPFNMWKGMKGRKLLEDYFYSLLPKKRATQTADFFSQFCHATDEDGGRFSDKEVVDHMIFLLMAAHDTTTSTLTTMFYALARHPEWQERLRRDSLDFGKAQLDFDDLEKMESLEWVMKEALRMYPPLTSMPRRTVKDCVFNGYLLKKDTLVGIYPIHTHYMPEYWTQPYQFDPERFSPSRAEHKKHMFQWIPFGGGAHMCLGQHFANLQVKAVMHQILQHYRWSIPEGYEMPYQHVPIAKPKDGLPVRLERI
ncbi:MAG: cytochrome P450 [Moraxellaceae bacterium]|nr:cytochrome P450 [Moraxellaceae bacterium]